MTRWKRHDMLRGGIRRSLLWFISVWLCIEGTTGSAWAQFDNELPVACFTSVTPPAPKIGEQVTISGTCSYDPDGVVFQYQWTFSDGQAAYTGSESSITRTFSQAGTYVVFLQVKDNDGAWSGKIRQNITVTASNFTVNIVPSAGCTVTAGDGGVDDVEAPNGIVCSGDMVADDPLCKEQFQNSAVATLKVTTEPGHAFTGWIVNDAQVKTAAEPLFLTTMPALASLADVLLANASLATCKIGCPEIVFHLITPDGSGNQVDTEVINLNYDDDDGDGRGLAHGESVIQSDKDDPNGVMGGDDDLLKLKIIITDSNSTIATYRLDYDETYLKLWKSSTKNLAADEFVASNSAELDIAQTSVYVEGFQPHGNMTGSTITLRALNAKNEEIAQRTVTVVVAHPIFAIFGGGPVSAAKTALDKYMSAYAIDQRMTSSLPGILFGNTISQTPVYYSVEVCMQTPKCAQFAKIALQTEGADVIFNGHANSGIGLSFAHEGEILVRTTDFFNMTGKRNSDSNPAIAGVAWAHELQINGPMQITEDEIPPTVENYQVLRGIVDQLKFPNDPDNPDDVVGVGETFTLTKQGATPMPDVWYHYQAPIVSTKHKFLLVKSGAEDVPSLHYRSLFLYLCSSGRYFLESFQHGQVFYTTADTSPQEEPTAFITYIISGMTWSQIETEMYGLDDTIAYHPF